MLTLMALVGLIGSIILASIGVMSPEQAIQDFSEKSTVVYGLSRGLIAWFFIVGVPFKILHPNLRDPSGMYDGCPEWMKRLNIVLMILGGLLFFSQFIQRPSVIAILLGGFGILAFSAMTTQLYAGREDSW